MMQRLHHLRLGCLATGIAVLLWVSPAQSVWQSFSPADGWAGGEVRSFFEDEAHTLWVASTSGVSAFDGLNWRSYGVGDGLPTSFIESIAVDRNQVVWVATTSGIALGQPGSTPAFRVDDRLPRGHWSGLAVAPDDALWAWSEGAGVARHDPTSDEWTLFPEPAGPGSGRIAYLLIARDGTPWCATQAGVAFYRGGTWTRLTAGSTGGGLADDRVLGMHEDARGRLWFWTESGVSRLDGTSWDSYGIAPQGPLAGPVRDVAEGPAGDHWFVTTNGVNRYRETLGIWLAYRAPADLSANAFERVLVDRNGFTWFVSNIADRVSRFDGIAWRTFTSVDGLAASGTSRMYEDHLGNLWFGSDVLSEQLTRTDLVEWSRFEAGSGLAASSIYAATVDTSGAAWLGTESGARRFDGRNWTTLDPTVYGASPIVNAILSRTSGELWIGTDRGALRCAAGNCQLLASPDSLPGEIVLSLLEDRSGRIWIGTDRGVAVRDDSGWRRYGAGPGGLVEAHVTGIAQADDGSIWFATQGGVSRMDTAGGWTNPTRLRSVYLNAAFRSADGGLWFGSDQSGLFRFDGTDWRVFTIADGLPNNGVLAIAQDSLGELWCGTLGGLARFDGTRWVGYSAADGLAGNRVNALACEPRGRVFVGSTGGLTLHTPDRVAPRAIFTPALPAVTGGRTLTLAVTPQFRESDDLRYEFSLDGNRLAGNGALPYLTSQLLADGEHEFACRAMDRAGNRQPDSTAQTVLVDATPPLPVIARPNGEFILRGAVPILGRAVDERYDGHVLRIRRAGDDRWMDGREDTLVVSHTPAPDTLLRAWETTLVEDGNYELQLDVSDALGLTGSTISEAIIDNQPPGAAVTSPVVISSLAGGEVFTTTGEAHAYFPPHSFDLDTRVELRPIRGPGVIASLPGGAIMVGPAFDLLWKDRTLGKRVVVDVALPEGSTAPDSTYAVYAKGADSTWVRLGGSLDRIRGRLEVALGEPARLVIGREGTASAGVPPGGSLLSHLAISPRVLRGGNTPSNGRVRVSFDLAEPTRVRVAVFNRAGRMIRELTPPTIMGRGSNVVQWDGLDRLEIPVPDGLYLISIELPEGVTTMPMEIAR